jgi:hypothetical protein
MPSDTAEIGKRLFGRPTRLTLGLYFVQIEQTSYLSEISGALPEVAASAIAQELANFVELGLLDRHEVTGIRRVYYTRTASPWWRIFETVAAVMDENARSRPRD